MAMDGHASTPTAAMGINPQRLRFSSQIENQTAIASDNTESQIVFVQQTTSSGPVRSQVSGSSQRIRNPFRQYTTPRWIAGLALMMPLIVALFGSIVISTVLSRKANILNADDAIIVVSIGAAFQMGFVGCCLVDESKHWGVMIIYVTLTAYFVGCALTVLSNDQFYAQTKRKQKSSDRLRHSLGADIAANAADLSKIYLSPPVFDARCNTYDNASQLYLLLKIKCRYRTLPLFVLLALISILLPILAREKIGPYHVNVWSNGTATSASVLEDVSEWGASIAWTCFFYIPFACGVRIVTEYVELRKQLIVFQQFTSPTQRSGLPQLDMFQRQHLAAWMAVRSVLVEDFAGSGSFFSVTYKPSSVFAAVMLFVSVDGFLAIEGDFVTFRSFHARRTFQITLGCGLFFSMLLIAAFAYITIRIAHTLSEQVKAIQAMETEVRLQLAVKSEHDDVMRQLSGSTLQMVKSFALHLRLCSAEPKVLGQNLRQIRWTVLIVLLLFLNVVLLMILYKRCHLHRWSSGSTDDFF